jgi:hypothetical protein
LEILNSDGTYGGRSYSEWLEQWSNLLVSASPDYQTGVDMFFLRGNLDYEADQRGNRTVKPGKFYDRTGSLGQTIYKNTALFIPVMTAMYSINDGYEAKQLLDEQDVRYAVRRDISEGGKMWLRFKTPKSEYGPVIKDGSLKDYYFETAMFTLRVSNQCPLIDKFEAPIIPGEYQTVQGAYCVIMTDLSLGTYRFHFGGNGKGYYYTDSVFDITVSDQESRDLSNDVSKQQFPTFAAGTKPEIQEREKQKAKKTFLHLKTESEIDDASPFP